MDSILVISNEMPYPPHRNGVCSTLFNYIKCWISSGSRVDVIYFSESEKDNEDYMEREFGVRCESINIGGREIFGKLSRHLVLKPRNSWHVESKSSKIIDAQVYDYIIFGSLSTFFIYDKIKNFQGRIVFFEADSVSLFYKRNIERCKQFLRKIYLWSQFICISYVEKRMYSLADDVFFVSNVDKEYTARKFRGHFLVNNIAVSVPEKYTKSICIEKEVECINLGFSGIMDYEPNIMAVDYIIYKIIPLLDSAKVNYRIHVIGKNPQEKWKNCNAFNEGKLIVTGFLENIDQYISSMDIYISPLFLGTGMKNKILQAMGLGVPIICSSVSAEGIQELRDDENVFILSENEHDWVTTIVELASDREKQRDFSEKCKEIIRNGYTWEQSAKKMLEGNVK